MYFYLIGINYRTAPLSIREALYRRRNEITEFWVGRPSNEAAVLVTCNRIEIYGAAENPDETFAHLKSFVRHFNEFSKYGYGIYGEKEVFRHGLRLATGLESQLQGERQILAQLNAWRQKENFSFLLKDFWDGITALSETIRYRSGLMQDTDNIATIILCDLKKRLQTNRPLGIIIVGTGKIAQLFIGQHLLPAGLTFVAHKNYQRAKDLARESSGSALLLEDLPNIISGADALISATSSPHYVLGKEHFINAVGRREHPLYLYDVAIPRDIEPQVADIRGLFLQGLDDLNEVFDEYNKRNKHRVNFASYLIDETVTEYWEGVYDKPYQGWNSA